MTGTAVGTAVLQIGGSEAVQALLDATWPWQLLLAVGAVVSLSVLYRIASPAGRWARRARSRLVLGIPWGTLLSIGFVLGVYLFLQGGLGHLQDPVTYAFQATSYRYPLGILTASFAHQHFGHLFGNLAGALVFGSIAEYGFSHVPTRRGETAFGSLRANPYARILAFFAGVVVAGMVFGAFSWGPVIGFSGVVYGLAGFALVVMPLVALLALLLMEISAVRLLYNAIMDPVIIHQPRPSSGGVWFADVAVQGHLFGFLIGALVAVVLLRRRDRLPDPGRVWFAVLVFGIGQGLWIAYWYLGNERYVLFRGPGVAFTLMLGAIVLVAVAGSDRRLLPAGWFEDRSFSAALPRRWTTAASVLVVALLAMAAVGAVINTRSIEGTNLPNDPVVVRDYQVGYTENVTNQQINVVDLPGLERATQIESSGVIVASAKRNVWQVTSSTRQLGFRGHQRVLVGGVGWREAVWITRTGWSVVGGESTYRVRLHPPEDPARTVFRSEPATSKVVIANRSISLRTVREEDSFRVEVDRNNETVGTAPLPAKGENVTAGDIRFQRVKDRLYANYRGTRVQVASKKEPKIEELRERNE